MDDGQRYKHNYQAQALCPQDRPMSVEEHLQAWPRLLLPPWKVHNNKLPLESGPCFFGMELRSINVEHSSFPNGFQALETCGEDGFVATDPGSSKQEVGGLLRTDNMKSVCAALIELQLSQG